MLFFFLCLRWLHSRTARHLLLHSRDQRCKVLQGKEKRRKKKEKKKEERKLTWATNSPCANATAKKTAKAKCRALIQQVLFFFFTGVLFSEPQAEMLSLLFAVLVISVAHARSMASVPLGTVFNGTWTASRASMTSNVADQSFFSDAQISVTGQNGTVVSITIIGTNPPFVGTVDLRTGLLQFRGTQNDGQLIEQCSGVLQLTEPNLSLTAFCKVQWPAQNFVAFQDFSYTCTAGPCRNSTLRSRLAEALFTPK